MPRKQVFLERRDMAKFQRYFLRAVLWEKFLRVNFKDGSYKETNCCYGFEYYRGGGKKRENEHFDYYITLRRRRLMNLLFLLLQNEALS